MLWVSGIRLVLTALVLPQPNYIRTLKLRCCHDANFVIIVGTGKRFSLTQPLALSELASWKISLFSILFQPFFRSLNSSLKYSAGKMVMVTKSKGMTLSVLPRLSLLIPTCMTAQPVWFFFLFQLYALPFQIRKPMEYFSFGNTTVKITCLHHIYGNILYTIWYMYVP